MLSLQQSPKIQGSSRSTIPLIRRSQVVQQPARSRSCKGTVMAQAGLNLPSNFGWVLGAAAFTGVVFMWQTVRIGAARRKYGVKLPNLYAKGDDQDSKTFNCIQRSHQNTAETIGPVMAATALLGLYNPITSAALCTAYAVGRIVYTLGYSTGDPSKRTPGFALSFFSMAGIIVTMGVVGIRTALQA